MSYEKLNKNGLSVLWNKIVSSFATKDIVSTNANGLVPKVTDTSKYLKGDGTWATPTNTTYSIATASKNGLMSSSDKSNFNSLTSADDITASFNAVFN